jgi:beta-mannosidase
VLPAAEKKVLAEANSTSIALKTVIDPLNPDLLDSTIRYNFDKYDPYVIYAALIDDKRGKVISSDVAWPQPFKYLDFSDREIKFEILETSAKVWRIRINAKKPVKGLVFEERRAMNISSNNFDIVPGSNDIEVEVKGIEPGELRYTYIGAPTGSMQLEPM